MFELTGSAYLPRNVKTPITTKSWIIKIPIDIFPYKESNCLLSDKSFITIIVLLNESAIAI